MRLENGSTGRKAEMAALGSALASRCRQGLAVLALPGAALLFPSSGSAQTQSIGPEATARGVTVLTRPRPDYDPTGVRLGAFRLDGAITAGMGYDDNLQPGTNNDQSDAFFGESLSLSANSGWTRHALGLSVTQDTRQYLQYNAQNWNDYGVGISGRYDIGRASSLRASYRHIHSHLSVDDFDVQDERVNRPIPYDSDVLLVGGTAAFNRLSLSTTATYSTIRYEEQTIDGRRTNNSANDRDSLLGEVQADYSIVQGRSLVGLVRLQDITYQETGQSGRDSFTWEVQGGFNYDFTGLWQARLLVGYRERNYEEPGRKVLAGPAFEGQVMLMPSQLATITVAAARTIEESIRESNVSYTRTAARVTVDYELLRNLIVTGELRAEHRDYPQRGTVTDGIGVLGAQLLLNRNLAVTANYQRTERLDAPEGLREYGVNQVQVRLRISL